MMPIYNKNQERWCEMMDLPITREIIDKWKKALKEAEPYNEEERCMYDGEWNPKRQKATTAEILLKEFGINPYNDNDYGNY